MGTFRAKLRVWNQALPEKVEELVAMVDTGPLFPRAEEIGSDGWFGAHFGKRCEVISGFAEPKILDSGPV